MFLSNHKSAVRSEMMRQHHNRLYQLKRAMRVIKQRELLRCLFEIKKRSAHESVRSALIVFIHKKAGEWLQAMAMQSLSNIASLMR